MPTPSEHRTFQARILACADAVGWAVVFRGEAEERRGLKERGLSSPRQIGERGGQECPPSVARAPLSLFFDELLDAEVREFNPRYAEDEAIALGVDQIRRYHRETPGLFVSQQLFTATDAIGFSYGVTWNTVRRNIFDWKLTEGGHSCPPVGEGRGLESPHSVGKWGLENPHSFFNPDAEIDVTRNRLPHWQQGETWVFVTWRLGDSLPKAKLDQWKAERDAWMNHRPEPWDEKTEAEYHERFSRQIDEWLDQGSGSCVLKDPANAKIVADSLRHFDGDRYELASFVVMPNHVHVLFRPLGEHGLAEIVKSWKGFTAREINKRLGKAGALWQDEYWDRLIRNERHFCKVAEYIRENPVKAKLREGQFILEGRQERGHSSPRPIEEAGGQECPPTVP